MKDGDIVVYNGITGRVVVGENEFRFRPVNLGRFYYSDLETITENDVKEATPEEKLELIKEEFTRGRVIKIHCIGDYQIIEYENKTDHRRLWHAYINYINTNNSYMSLDSALISCMGRKYEGANGRAAIYFEKMIGLK